jgi:hypothetical protein
MDGDGFSNILELAFGSSPRASVSRPNSLIGQWQVNGSFRPALFFRRQAGGLFNYTVESSVDLKQWASAGGELGAPTVFNAYDGTGTAVTILPLTAATNAPDRRFFRVRAAPR